MNVYNELFEKLKEQDVVNYLDLPLHNVAGVWKGPCPAGHESTSGESFQINNKKFHCWNCGMGGNLIHLIEFVKFKTISKKKITDTHRQARDIACNIAGVGRLFDMHLSLEEVQALEEQHIEQIIVSDVLGRAVELMNKKLLASFKGDYCKEIDLKREAIEKFKIGFCYPNLLTELKREFELKEIELSGLVERTGEKRELSLLKRYIFPFIRGGRVVYLSGRISYLDKEEQIKYKKISLHSDKRPYISKFITNDVFFNEDVLRESKDICILEGLTDCIAAEMNGIRAIASSSANTKEEVFLSLIPKLKNIQEVFTCYDVEESEAGQKAAEKVAATFLKEKKEIRNIELPLDGKKKNDVRDYFKTHTKEDFLKLKERSKTLIEKMIEKIDQVASRNKTSKDLMPVLQLMALTDDITINNYLNYLIKNTFKLKNQDISVYRSEIKRIQKGSTEKTPQKKTHENKELKTLGQGMDFLDNTLFYTVFDQQLETYTDPESGDVKTKIVQVPYIVTSKKEYIKANPEDLLKRGLFFNKALMPSLGLVNQWSINQAQSHTIMDFIRNGRTVKPEELYKKIKYYFDQYIVFPEKNIAVHLTIAIMASYVLMVFDTIGYIHLHAEKRSGKTRALEIIEGLAYNAVMSSSISDASLFRVIEATRCLLITDEAENLDPSVKAQATNPSEKIQLLNAGYKKSGAAIRVETIGNTLTPVKYSTYSIKVFAGIKEINSVLRDRTITHLLKRATGTVKHFVPSALVREWSEIRNQLHIFGMEYASRISEIYRLELPIVHKDVLERNGIVSREYEIWAPYLSLAKLIDEKGGLDTFGDLLNIASVAMSYKQQLENDSYSNRLLTLINEFVQENDASEEVGELKDYYNLTDMTNFIKGHEGFEFVTSNVLSKNMYGKMYLADAKEKKRVRRENQNVKDTYLRITKKALSEALERAGVKS